MQVRGNLLVFAATTAGLCGLGLIGTLVAYRSGASPSDAASSVRLSDRPDLTREWQLYRGQHWRIYGSVGEDPEITDEAEKTRGMCSAGMVEIEGNFLLDPSKYAAYDQNSVEELQKTACTTWINRDYPERCLRFDRDKWLTIKAELKTKPMHFCMDRYEYPNRKGEYPIIYVDYHEAAALCAEEGKRLCNEEEWTFACEGDEGTPYPNGYFRDPEGCIQDRRWKPFNETAMHPRDGVEAMYEMDRLWQGVPSGSRDKCRSSFGVYDLTGNVDEWTSSVREGERPSILKGGYWGPVRTRCRPSTRSHEESHAFYQQGVRCCSDVGAQAYRKTPIPDDPSVVRLPAAVP